MEKSRMVMIFCASPKQITSAERHYKSMKGDEKHCLFNYKDVLGWIDVSKILGKFPDVAIVDLEMSKGDLLFSKINREFPGAVVLGIRPSQKKEP